MNGSLHTSAESTHKNPGEFWKELSLKFGNEVRFFGARHENRIHVHFFLGIKSESILQTSAEFSDALNQSLSGEKDICFLAPFSIDDLANDSPAVVIEPQQCLSVSWSKQEVLEWLEPGLPCALPLNPLQLSSEQKSDLRSKIESVVAHQVEGDCYLLNLATVLSLETDISFAAQACFFLFLASSQRHGGFVCSRDRKFGVCLSSPETFLEVSLEGQVLTQPIKGTRPLTSNAGDLWMSQKEMSEHLMVIDLLRNDLNEICVPGSVRVSDPYEVKEQNGLLQMQSRVMGTLQSKSESDWSLFFPPGSVSGTPKKACLEIIQRLEKLPRGYFAGTTGCVVGSQLVSAINIRSLYWGPKGSYTAAGAGLTTLSDPSEEVQEIQLKLSRTHDHWSGLSARSKTQVGSQAGSQPGRVETHPRVLFIDHYDSFSSNIVAALRMGGLAVVVLQWDRLVEMQNNLLEQQWQGIIVSPGPGHPKDYPATVDFIRNIDHGVPVFGVCLGFQILCHLEGCQIKLLEERPVHGRRISTRVDFDVRHTGGGFAWSREDTWAYFNSWGVDSKDSQFLKNFVLNGEMSVPEGDSDQVAVAASHKSRPWILCQFHPDSYGSPSGGVFLNAVCKWIKDCAKLGHAAEEL